ncbi:TetR/AcrR family transcriptional regulator [Streptomyces hoynatensis]|nr:TetR/AcrR family transcriptional regulator [Streptomyces hoynatensis]
MSSPTGRRDPRRRADAVRNRRLVLDAAKALLARADGAVTVEAIAREAGVGAATVVRSFGSKDALLDAAVSDLLGPLVRRGRQALEEPDAERALRGFLAETMAFQSAHLRVGEQLRGLDLPATGEQRAALREVEDGLVARAREQGAIRTDIAAEAVMTMVGEATSAVARAGADAGPAAQTLYEAFLTVLLDGLRPQAPRA